MFKINNRNTRERCEIRSKLTITRNNKHENNVIDVVLVFLLLILNIFYTSFSSVSIVNFEQVNVSWDTPLKLLYQFMSAAKVAIISK